MELTTGNGVIYVRETAQVGSTGDELKKKIVAMPISDYDMGIKDSEIVNVIDPRGRTFHNRTPRERRAERCKWLNIYAGL